MAKLSISPGVVRQVFGGTDAMGVALEGGGGLATVQGGFAVPIQGLVTVYGRTVEDRVETLRSNHLRVAFPATDAMN